MLFSYITWNADPSFFNLGAMNVRWYSVLLLLGFYLSYRFMKRIYEKEGKSTSILFSYGIAIIAGILIGGRLMHCLAYEPDYYLSHPWDIIKPWRGKLGQNAMFIGYRGMSGHGSAIGMVIGIVINALRTKSSIVFMLDRTAIFGPFVGAFVRIGNFMNSEILGTPSDLPWAVLFARTDPIPRHPVQLYESLAYFLIFFLSYKYYKSVAGKEKPGAIIGFVLILVYIARFFLEFFKAHQSDMEAGMTLNMGHLLSIPMIIIGIVLYFRPQKKKSIPKKISA